MLQREMENPLVQYILDPEKAREQRFFNAFFVKNHLLPLLNTGMRDFTLQGLKITQVLAIQIKQHKATQIVIEKILEVLQQENTPKRIIQEGFSAILCLGGIDSLSEEEFLRYAGDMDDYVLVQLLSNYPTLPSFCISWLVYLFYQVSQSNLGIVEPLVELLGNLGQLSPEIIKNLETNRRNKLFEKWMFILNLVAGKAGELEVYPSNNHLWETFMNREADQIDIARAGIQLVETTKSYPLWQRIEMRERIHELQGKYDTCLIQTIAIYMLLACGMGADLDLQVAKQSRYVYVQKIVQLYQPTEYTQITE